MTANDALDFIMSLMICTICHFVISNGVVACAETTVGLYDMYLILIFMYFFIFLVPSLNIACIYIEL